ncbi:MAG: glycosyl hydrolase [Candidatus Aminicenantales bacterium]
MNKRRPWIYLFLGIVLLVPGCQKPPDPNSYLEVRKAFQDPPAEYRSAPLWVWNDRVTKDAIETQLADFQSKGIGGVFIHPRPGLITPYLSEAWLELFRHAVMTGKSLGMKVWIYDENSYPSGFAGGIVPEEMPDSIGLGLKMSQAKRLPRSFEVKPATVLRKSGTGFEDITSPALQLGEANNFGEGIYYIFSTQKAKFSPWFGGFTYVDLMRRDVTEKFLDVTLNAYKRVIGDEFGTAVPGSFQDEAHIHPAGGPDTVNFTPQLFEVFQKKWGYDLRLHLPSLFEEVGDWLMVRHNFYATTLGLFIEGWARPYFEYCEVNNLQLTGHYWEHEWPIPRLSPDNMAMAAFAQMPGIDCLMNQWETGPHAQFGNARAVKEIRSAASQLGRPRTLSETYGAGGWDLTFGDQKRIADWEFALGINFINQHLSYMTIMGARKRDHPQSFSYHEPWWPAYRIMGDYLGRLSVAMSKGGQMNKILVLEPTTTAWMHYSPGTSSERLTAVGEGFTDFINRLEATQVEYDLGSEDILRNHGRAENQKLVVGERSYDVVVLPAEIENLNEPTLDLLSRYLEAGGRVLCLSERISFIDGRPSDRPDKLASAHPADWVSKTSDEAVEDLTEACVPDIHFSNIEGDPSMFFHHRRVLSDAEVVFLANINSTEGMSGQFEARGQAVETWDPFTGKVSPYPGVPQEGRVAVKFEIPPGGSRLFCLRPKKGSRLEESESQWGEHVPDGELSIRAESPNILTIDYCDLKIGDREVNGLYFYEAQLRAFQHYGLDRNPWDSAVQYRTNILDLDDFAPNSGFEAAYWFEVGPGLDFSSFELVVERPALYQVYVNEQKVEPLPDRWWLDRANGVFEIGSQCRPGRNRVALKASPFTIHTELEPIFILGDFGLESTDKGFLLVPAAALKPGPWSEQGRPFYPGGVIYSKTYTLGPPDPRRERVVVSVGEWRGSVAEVRVNGKSAGYVVCAPFELDITDSLSAGRNTVETIVFGTLKNTLGPHHNSPALGTAWPGMFQKGAEGGYPPGSAYSLVGYGLFEDFKVLSRAVK